MSMRWQTKRKVKTSCKLFSTLKVKTSYKLFSNTKRCKHHANYLLLLKVHTCYKLFSTSYMFSYFTNLQLFFGDFHILCLLCEYLDLATHHQSTNESCNTQKTNQFLFSLLSFHSITTLPSSSRYHMQWWTNRKFSVIIPWVL